MTREIDLYINSRYCGFFPLDTVEEYFSEYEERACQLAEYIDWDEVVLYAIFSYDGEKQTFISADFMTLRLDYDRYAELCKNLSPDCRLFIKRNL